MNSLYRKASVAKFKKMANEETRSRTLERREKYLTEVLTQLLEVLKKEPN
jgi:vacuolar-type H+-ATPase subunit E/Vma4